MTERETTRETEVDQFLIENGSAVEPPSSPNLSSRRQIKWAWNTITVEPLLLAYVIPWSMSMIANQNLALEKACRINLNYSDEICDALSRRDTLNYTTEEDMVQQVVAGMTRWKTIIQSGVPCILILFWGSWSDRHGRRKPCMMLPILGELLAAIGLILCVYFDQVPMEVAALVESLLPALAGGWSTIMMGVFSYVADFSTDADRTLRIGIINLCVSLGMPLGMTFSGILLSKIGFYGIFTITASLYLCALIYGGFVVKEINRSSLAPIETTHTSSFFDKKHVLETFQVAFKDDINRRRLQMIMLFVVLIVVDGPLNGEMSVLYLFTRYRFNWSELEFSLFTSYAMITGFFGVMFAVGVLSHHLKIQDAIIGAIASSSKILSSFLYAFAQTNWQITIGPILEIISGASAITMRSIATKLVGPDEFGKVNSLFGVVGSLVPLIYAPLYASVYIATLKFLPGAFFLLTATLSVPAICCFLWIYRIHKKIEKNHLQTEPFGSAKVE